MGVLQSPESLDGECGGRSSTENRVRRNSGEPFFSVASNVTRQTGSDFHFFCGKSQFNSATLRHCVQRRFHTHLALWGDRPDIKGISDTDGSGILPSWLPLSLDTTAWLAAPVRTFSSWLTRRITSDSSSPTRKATHFLSQIIT